MPPNKKRKNVNSVYEVFPRQVPGSKKKERQWISAREDIQQQTAHPTAPPAGKYWVAFSPGYLSPYRPKVDKGDALSRLRPALHPDDVVASSTGNPSEDIHPSAWAKRWGLHSEGPPGRSRTTPTREDFAFSAADDPEGAAPVTKKWLMEYFDGVALDYKLDMSDWIEDILPSLHLSNDDRAYLEWLDKLKEDEAWQCLVFGDLTSNDVSMHFLLARRRKMAILLANTLDPRTNRFLICSSSWIPMSSLCEL